jgi:hypothetical protein
MKLNDKRDDFNFPIASSNPAHGEVYLIQHYVIKFVSDLRQVSGFLQVLRFSSINKTDGHDITEILLKVPLSNLWYPLFQAQWDRCDQRNHQT